MNNNNRYNSNFRPRPVADYSLVSCQKYPLISISTPEQPSTRIVGLDELLDLYIRCKNTKLTCVEFDVSLIRGLILLHHHINDMNIFIDEVRAFIVEIPKLREIIFCPYKDKLVQSFYVLSINKYLENEWFLEDSYSCRQNKGVIRAIETFQKYVFEESNGYEIPVWLSSFDIYHFFLRIDCKLAAELMMDFIREHLSDHPRKELLIYLTRLLYLTDYTSNIITDKYYTNQSNIITPDKTLVNNPPFIGVPIGNWPSQIIGNFLTTFVLLYIKGLGYKFIHYTDDTAVVIKDKDKYLSDIKLIRNFYTDHLHLQLHPDKFYLQPLYHGINILGRKLKYNRILPSDRTYNTIINLVNDAVIISEGFPDTFHEYAEIFMRTLNSYLGLLRSMNTFNFRRKIQRMLWNTKWMDVIEFEGHMNCIWVKKKYTSKEKYRIYSKGLKTKNIIPNWKLDANFNIF